MRQSIHINKKATVYILLFSILLFSKFAIAQPSTTYTISGYCGSINLVGSITTYSDQIMDVAVQSTRAYLTASSLGLRVVDISTPSQPVEIGHYQTPDSTQFIIVNGNYAYLGQQNYMFRIIDISDPANMVEVGNFATSTSINNMSVSGGYAFFDHGTNGLEIVDIHNFSNMTDVINTKSFNQTGIAVESTYLYITINGEFTGQFEVFDISSISNIKEIGYCTLGTNQGGSIYLGNKYAYVVFEGYLLTIIDRSNPFQPVVVGGYDYTYGDGSWSNLQIVENGNFLYFGNKGSIQVVDIHNPANPVGIGYYDTPDWVLGLDYQNNYLYAATRYSGLRVFDVNNPISGASVNLTGDTTLFTTMDTTGYYGFTGIPYGNYTVTPTLTNYQFNPIQRVYSDLTNNQTDQSYIGNFTITVNINSIPSGQTATANGVTSTTPFSTNVVSGNGSGFSISVNAPVSIDSVTQLAFGSWSDSGAQSHTVYPTISTTYTVSFDTQYYLVANSNHDNGGEIKPIGGWISQNSLVSCTAVPNNGFQFVNWTGDLNGNNNPATLLMDGPQTIGANFSLISSGSFKIGGYCTRPDLSGNYYEVGHILSENESYSLTINGTLAFLADGTAGLRIINISNPSNPIALSNFTTSDSIYGIAVRGNYAYVAAGTTGFYILDISNPSHPLEVGSFYTTGNALRVVVQGNYAYVAFDLGGLFIIDISNPANPIVVSYIPGPSMYVGNSGIEYSHMRQVVIKGNYAYIIGWNYGYYLDCGIFDENSYDSSTELTCEFYTPFAFNDLIIVNIQNPINPQIVGTFSYGGYWTYDINLYNFEISGNYAYLADFDSGLIILDISNPSSPVEISAAIVPGNPDGLSVRGDFAYIASESTGLQVANIANPYSPYIVNSYQTPGLAQDVRVSGDYAYIADDTSGLRIIHVAYPIPNTMMTLSGTTNQFTYSDSSGYYSFNYLPFGNYTVIPSNNLFGSFSPSTNTYTGLDYNQLNEDYVGTYSAWTDTNGEFTNASDTLNWAYQTSPNVSSQPNISWLSTYQGNTGILQLTFSHQTQGIKMTSFTRFTPDTSNPWYRLRVSYYSNSKFNGYIIPVILTYQDKDSDIIQEIGASFTGNSLIQSGKWYTLDAYLYCHDTSGQIQLIINNNGSAGNFYIDSIDLENVSPPGLTNSTYVSVPWGGFEMSTETSYWGLQTAPGTTNGEPTLGWETSYSTQSGVMSYSFTTSSQGVKMTTYDTFSIPTNSNAILSFKILSDSPTPTGLSVIGYLFAEKDVNNYIWDVGAVGNIGILPGDTWNTIYVSLTSVSQQTSYRLQLLVKNTTQYPETIYLDDIQLFYGTDSLGIQNVIMLVSKPRELMD